MRSAEPPQQTGKRLWLLWIKRAVAVVLIVLVLISPYFLLLNFDLFAPVVLTVWMLSAAYYVFAGKRD